MVLTAVNAINILNFLFQSVHYYRQHFNVQHHRRPNAVGNILNLIQIIYNFLKWVFNKWRLRRKNLNTPSNLIKILRQYRCTRQRRDFWNNLEQNWTDFFWLTGDTPHTLDLLVQSIRQTRLTAPRNRRRCGRKKILSLRNEVLLTMIWLRRYPTMYHLSHHFAVPVSLVHSTIFKMIPVFHTCLVPKYIKWPNNNQWLSFRNTFPDWPNVVAILDCTPVRCSRPVVNAMQRFLWRRDRHCFFLNWVVIQDVNGFVVFSRPGFFGHLNDATCYRHLQIPPLPNGLQIMADQGFPNIPPLLLPVAPPGIDIPDYILRSFRHYRNSIERCFGNLKSSYFSVGTKRYRGQRWIVPLICNITASLYNRRKIHFNFMRRQLHV